MGRPADWTGVHVLQPPDHAVPVEQVWAVELDHLLYLGHLLQADGAGGVGG